LSCSFADNFGQRKDCYKCGMKRHEGAEVGARQNRRERGQSGRGTSPAPPPNFGELIKREAARLQGLSAPLAPPALVGAAATTPDPAAPAPAPAAAAAPDPLAPARSRFKEINSILQHTIGISDPTIGAARARLEEEKETLGLQLHSALPLKAQLRSATTHLQQGLSAFAAMHSEIQELELVLDDRRRALEEQRLSTIAYRLQVDELTSALREEDSERLVAIASQYQNAAGPALAAPPTLAPTPSLSYAQLAEAFLAQSTPTVAANFKRFLDEQAPVSAAPAPPVAPAHRAATAPSLTTQLVSRRQQRAGATAALAPAAAPQAAGALPAAAPALGDRPSCQTALALPAPAPTAAEPGSLATAAESEPIDVDQEEVEETIDWSGTGLALPVGFAPAGTPSGRVGKPARGSLPFGKVTPASRSIRGAPYGSSELADAMATAQVAELLLASSPEQPATLEPPGGVGVKLESASA
jgi:hypothetical protein